MRRSSGASGGKPHRCAADARGGAGYPPPVASRTASVSPPPIPVLHLEDICGGLREGMDALIGDSLTQCFTSEPAEPWNFLTRSLPPGPISMRPYFAAVWLAGVWIRYAVLLPLRLATLFVGIVLFFVGFAFVSTFFPRRSPVTVAANKFLIRYLASVFVASWSGYVRFHGQRPVPAVNQIYVANHTSLIDVFLLIKDYPFACIGQRHGGLAGALQDLVNTVQNHVWFDREEGRDRAAVQRLLTAHVSTPGNEPMLVFPEGTCVNNRYCIMFKKGSFQLGATVFPVAIKYHRGFADPFWNSSAASFPRHLLDLMTSWAVVADVYYLPPEKQRPGEDAAAFASRVKELIAARAGLISVGWDGFLIVVAPQSPRLPRGGAIPSPAESDRTRGHLLPSLRASPYPLPLSHLHHGGLCRHARPGRRLRRAAHCGHLRRALLDVCGGQGGARRGGARSGGPGFAAHGGDQAEGRAAQPVPAQGAL